MNLAFHITALTAVLFYVGATALYLRSLWKRVSLSPRRFLAIGAVGHALFIGLSFYSGENYSSFSYFTSSLSLGIVAAYLFFSRSNRPNSRFDSLGAFVSPLALFFFSISSVVFHFSDDSKSSWLDDPLLVFHVASTLIGIAVFSIAAIFSLALIFQETLLKNRSLHTLTRKFPPISSLEFYRERFIIVGFLVLLVGVSTGFYLTSGKQSLIELGDPLLLASCFALMIYAFVILAGKLKGLRGRRAAILSFCGYLLMIFSLVGANFIENFHVYK